VLFRSVTLGVLWSQGKISFLESVLFIQAGLLPANAFMVGMGKRFGLPLIHRRPFKWMLDPAEVAQWLELIRNNTKKVIFFARFVPMIRGPIYFATGMSQLELSKFSKIDYIASLLQLPVLLFLGRWIGTNAGSLIDAFQKIGLLFLILFSWMIAFGMIRKRRSALPKA